MLNANLASFLVPQHFDTFLRATRDTCAFYATTRSKLAHFDKPTQALKLGRMLMLCAVLAGCEANKQRNLFKESVTNDYVKLYDLQWTTKMSSLAL